MSVQRRRMNRALPRTPANADPDTLAARADTPRPVGRAVVDIASLNLPEDVSLALAEAFWKHFGPRSNRSILDNWKRLRAFGRFVAETQALKSLSDLRRELLAQYIEWLYAQPGVDGAPLSKATQSGRYSTLRTLLRWIERCRPGLIAPIHYPFNPFPWRNRDQRRRRTLSAQDLRAILNACEHDIAQTRLLRERGRLQRASARADDDPESSLGALLELIDRRFGGIAPPAQTLERQYHIRIATHGHLRDIEPHLYPSRDGLLPYYLAILIHTAGNPEAIAALGCDCLQPIPLLEDREMLAWMKPRASAAQRRSFRSTDPFEPPALVREILEWTTRLRPHVSAAQRNRLFLAKSVYGIRTLSRADLHAPFRRFVARHKLPPFALAAIRPSVLTAFYQASGDLRQAKAVANHAHLSTTVGYIQGPQVEAQNRMRIAALQSAFLGHLDGTQSDKLAGEAADLNPRAAPCSVAPAPSGTTVSMFGFGCRDPFSGIAPGTRRGELCTNFLGCLTCPNAIIADDARTLARLLQVRDHLRAAAAQLHPARWEAIYAPPLRILEEDLLTRFAAHERVAAERLLPTLPQLPPLR
jgi:hypothetical protein